MRKIGAFLYFFLFVGLVAGFIYGLFWLHPYLLYFYVACLFLMYARYALKIKNRVTMFAVNCLTSLDQHWQVTLAPILNLAPDLVHRFGNPDETASSVIGKNLRATNARHWIMIELLLSAVLEGGRPHSIPSIED